MNLLILIALVIVIVLQLLGLYAAHRNKDAWDLGTKTVQDALNKVKT